MIELQKDIKLLKSNHFYNIPNLQKAWELLNEYPTLREKKCLNGNAKVQGGVYGLYDIILHSTSSRIDKNFDFGVTLGYTYKKWTKLIRNYVNPHYLDLVKNEIQLRESKARKKSQLNYNYTYHFDNAFGNGKDCLISVTFSRRRGNEKPVITYNTRASEITKRLIFDFLLIQRIVEYVYGYKMDAEVICHINFGFLNLECYLMYVSYKGLDNMVNQNKPETPWQEKIVNKYNKFLNTPLENITFKVSQRAAAQVKKDSDGNPVAGVKSLKAKELTYPFKPVKKDNIIKLLGN